MEVSLPPSGETNWERLGGEAVVANAVSDQLHHDSRTSKGTRQIIGESEVMNAGGGAISSDLLVVQRMTSLSRMSLGSRVRIRVTSKQSFGR
jgi:hypothetical protein